MEHIDPNQLNNFQIPENILDRLFEFTGSASDQSKGFILAYVDQHGNPMIYCRSGTQIVDMGIRKALENYLIEIENADSTFDTGEE
jgi:hypothetical protein